MSPETAARHILELVILEGLQPSSTCLASHFRTGHWQPENYAAGLRYGYLRGWFKLSWDHFDVTEAGRQAACPGMLVGRIGAGISGLAGMSII